MIAALVSLSIQAQSYYQKEAPSHEQKYTYQSGIISLGERQLSINPSHQEERIYYIDFEPVETPEGLYFTATFDGREFEFWYNLDLGYLKTKRGSWVCYYWFNWV